MRCVLYLFRGFFFRDVAVSLFHPPSPSLPPTCLAGEILAAAEPFLEQQMHPTVIIRAFRQALDDILTICKDEIGWVWSRLVVGVAYFSFVFQPRSGHER